MFVFILIYKEREGKRDWQREREMYIYIYLYDIYIYSFCFTPLPIILTNFCAFLRMSGFGYRAKVSSLRLFIEQGSVYKINILRKFQLILLFLTETLQEALEFWKEHGETLLNLHNFKELDFPHLHPDGGGHWGCLASCDLAWSSLRCWENCPGYDTGMADLFGFAFCDLGRPQVRPEKENRRNLAFLPSTRGFLWFPWHALVHLRELTHSI